MSDAAKYFFYARRRQFIVTGALIVLWLIFVAASPQTFLSYRIYRSFMSTIPVVGILSLAVTLLVVVGESDLSFPSVAAVGAWIFSALYAHCGLSPFMAFVAALLGGVVMGLMNGFLVVNVGVPSMITTIGTQFFWRGAVMLASDGLAIPLADIVGHPLHSLFVGRIGSWGVPAQALWMVVSALALSLLLHRHPFGDSILFVGDSRSTAEMMGVNSKAVRIGVFAIVGGLSAFAGLISTLELNNWWPTQGDGTMLLVFASIFVGGTAATGGNGTLYGTFVGAIIIGIIEAGIVSAGLVGFWTRFIHGLVIILSVSGYALLARRRAAVSKEAPDNS